MEDIRFVTCMVTFVFSMKKNRRMSDKLSLFIWFKKSYDILHNQTCFKSIGVFVILSPVDKITQSRLQGLTKDETLIFLLVIRISLFPFLHSLGPSFYTLKGLYSFMSFIYIRVRLLLPRFRYLPFLIITLHFLEVQYFLTKIKKSKGDEVLPL